MIEVSASFTSVEASYTKLQAVSERSALAIEKKGAQPQPSSVLNNQQQQIVDEVGISEAAIAQFEEAQALADQLQNYLNYLNGNAGDLKVQITANDNQPDVSIAGESTKLSASIEIATYKEETLDINAKFDDAGNLQELSVNKTSVSAEYVRADVSFESTQFFAQV